MSVHNVWSFHNGLKTHQENVLWNISLKKERTSYKHLVFDCSYIHMLIRLCLRLNSYTVFCIRHHFRQQFLGFVVPVHELK